MGATATTTIRMVILFKLMRHCCHTFLAPECFLALEKLVLGLLVTRLVTTMRQREK